MFPALSFVVLDAETKPLASTSSARAVPMYFAFIFFPVCSK